MVKLKNFVSHALVFASGAVPVVVALEAVPGEVGVVAKLVAGVLSGVLSVVHRMAAPLG